MKTFSFRSLRTNRFALHAALAAFLFMPQFAGSQLKWTIHPIVTSSTTLPHTKKPAFYEGRGGSYAYILEDQIYIKEKSGIFLASLNSIIPIVTDLDTIPGTQETFKDFVGLGGIRTQQGHEHQVIGEREVAFMYWHNDKLLCCVASPGKPVQAITFPDTVFLGTQWIVPDYPKSIGAWFCERRNGKIKVFLQLIKFDQTRRMLGWPDFSDVFFSYDGQSATKILMAGDTLSTPERLIIHTVYGWFNGPAIVRDPFADRWMLQAGILRTWNSELNAWGKGGAAILLIDSGAVRSMFIAGDSICNVPKGSLTELLWFMGSRKADQQIWWSPDFSHDRVILFGQYRTADEEPFEGFFTASNRKVERIAAWKNGDVVPGTAGGMIKNFWKTGFTGINGKTPAYSVHFQIDLEKKRIFSYAAISGSKSRVKEGILLYDDGRIQKIVAQNDTIIPGRQTVLKNFSKFYFFDTGEIFFIANDSLYASSPESNASEITRNPGILGTSNPKLKYQKLSYAESFFPISGKAVVFRQTSSYYIALRE